MFLRDCRHVAALTLSDLGFEWILSLCMVLALGAVFAPLFILLGLQEGIVGNMLEKVQRDPLGRLVSPKSIARTPLDDEWLSALRSRSAAVIGSLQPSLPLYVEGSDEPVTAVPTIAEDPLLLEHGIRLPEERLSLVLSERLARRTGKGSGDPFEVILLRRAGREERVPLTFQVAGVLPEAVTDRDKIWLPAHLLDAFYRWRKGEAVPELGLSGRGASLEPEYDGVLTLLEELPSQQDELRILGGMQGRLDRRPELIGHAGWAVPPGRLLRLWRPAGGSVEESDRVSLANRHLELGYRLEAVPYLDGLEVSLQAPSLDPVWDRHLSLTILPASLQGDEPPQEGMPPPVWVAWETGVADGTPGELAFASGEEGREVRIPVRLFATAHVMPGYVAVPPGLGGKIKAAIRQEAVYDPATGELTPVSRGVRFFRAYAKSIDDLESLVAFVRKEGERRADEVLREPVSRLAQVRNIRELAGYMEQLYLLMVLVAGVSGFFAIAASVYAGVERKRRDLAYLQLLGLHPGALFLFPYLKSLTLVAGGLLAALGAYAFFGHFADRLFAQVLGGAESLTRLTAGHIALLTAGILVSASLASLLAALAVIRIEPGEYIRE
jgi:putative ABC transport system permease protein